MALNCLRRVVSKRHLLNKIIHNVFEASDAELLLHALDAKIRLLAHLFRNRIYLRLKASYDVSPCDALRFLLSILGESFDISVVKPQKTVTQAYSVPLTLSYLQSNNTI